MGDDPTPAPEPTPPPAPEPAEEWDARAAFEALDQKVTGALEGFGTLLTDLKTVLGEPSPTPAPTPTPTPAPAPTPEPQRRKDPRNRLQRAMFGDQRW